MRINIELFCGTAGFTKVCSSFGIECISIDQRRRKGTCEPHIKMDIAKMPVDYFSGMKPFIIWVGLPCDIWSYASGGFHINKDFYPKTKKAVEHIKLLYHIFRIIEKSAPDFWFIENPRGKLKNHPFVKEKLESEKAFLKETSLDNYGFPTIKPTNILTNYKNLQLKPISRFGRGNKNKVPGTFDNMTKVQRQKTPEKLYRSIINQCLNYDT